MNSIALIGVDTTLTGHCINAGIETAKLSPITPRTVGSKADIQNLYVMRRLPRQKVARMGKDRVNALIPLGGRRRDLDDPGPQWRSVSQLSQTLMELRHADKRHKIKAVKIKRAAKARAFTFVIAQFTLRARKIEPQRPGGRVSSSSACVIICRRLRIPSIDRDNPKRIECTRMRRRDRQNCLIMFGRLGWLARLLRRVSAI